MISVKNLEKPYKSLSNEVLYLNSINLEVPPQEATALVGKSDSGKSVLLCCLNLIERPLTGIITIDNKNLTAMMSKDLRKFRNKVSYISQKTNLLDSKTVAENVAWPLLLQNSQTKDIHAIIEPILAITQLTDKHNFYPSQLNYLQKQKTALARALVLKPAALLCDEITANMDYKATQAIIQILKDIKHEYNLAMLLSTNDLEIIKNVCSRVAVMHQGTIIEQTSSLKFFLDPTSSIAKDFIKAATRMELPSPIRRRILSSKEPHSIELLRFAFIGCLSPEILFAQVIEKFGLKFNILQAYREKIQDETINLLISEIYGNVDKLTEACEFLKNKGINTEVIGYVERDT